MTGFKVYLVQIRPPGVEHSSLFHCSVTNLVSHGAYNADPSSGTHNMHVLSKRPIEPYSYENLGGIFKQLDTSLAHDLCLTADLS